MEERYDLAVIGAGPGGYEAAIRAAQLGLKVAIIEEKDFGGTCLNWGCIPTKSLLHSAEVYQTVLNSGRFGVHAGPVGFDYEEIAKRKDTVVRQLRSGVESLLKSNGCTMIKGRATFLDQRTLAVDGAQKQTVQADHILIATGSRPFRPPIHGIDGPKVLDSDGVLALKSCPEKIIIIGGGVIGVEFSTVFANLGKEVTIIEMMDMILPGIDLEIAALLRRSLEKKGIKIYTGAKVTQIRSLEQAECTFQQDGQEHKVTGDQVIVAIGRKPNTEALGLEKAGVKTERGFIRTDDYLQTSVPGIYAIGDVIGKTLLAHVASAQGLVAAANITGKRRRMNNQVIPGCIYTSPEIASVGLTESEALKLGRPVGIGRFPVQANGKSMILDEKEGLVKIITDQQTGEILGAHIMAPRASDLIGELCVAMRLESTIEEVGETIHPHPTVSEMIREAADDAEGLCINKPMSRKP